MPGAPACRSSAIARSVRTILLALAPLTLLASAPTLAAAVTAPAEDADQIRLPAPVRDVDPLQGVNLGLRPDRLRKSVVPGTASDREDVVVAVGPTGAPAAVIDTQRLVIDGAGNYIVRELGPARVALGLNETVPPVLELGTVVWQGFSPGHRELSARLTLDAGITVAGRRPVVWQAFPPAHGGLSGGRTLDAGIEAARLPLKVTLRLPDPSGHVR